MEQEQLFPIMVPEEGHMIPPEGMIKNLERTLVELWEKFNMAVSLAQRTKGLLNKNEYIRKALVYGNSYLEFSKIYTETIIKMECDKKKDGKEDSSVGQYL